ncbi:MAG: 4'-phosphopantetheinyl transferase superfamily protein [Campylobacter sp.]|nr:4'-phosphopantetheinyl transferase superfamily protein [Campylobacter sp.]
MSKIKLFISTKIDQNYKLYRKDRRRLRKNPALKNSTSFMLSRSLKWRYKLKDKICIAHKKNICVIAKFNKKIGIDVEELKDRNFDAVIDFCFNEDEILFVRNSPDKILAFYQVFTVKEAYIKIKNLDFSHLKSVDFNKILNIMQINYIIFNNFLITIIFYGKYKG